MFDHNNGIASKSSVSFFTFYFNNVLLYSRPQFYGDLQQVADSQLQHLKDATNTISSKLQKNSASNNTNNNSKGEHQEPVSPQQETGKSNNRQQ